MRPSCPITRRRILKQSAAAAVALSTSCAPDSEEGFVPLFNGRDLRGWEGDPLLWVVEDGMLIGRSPGIEYNDFLATETTYSDFILRFRVQLVDNIGNSGVQFRSKRMAGSMEMIGYQADIGPGWWGNLYDESRRRVTLVQADEQVLEEALDPTGWNEYEVQAEGDHIRLSINGTVTADYREEDAEIARSGLIATQIHSGPALEVRFQDIRIKEL